MFELLSKGAQASAEPPRSLPSSAPRGRQARSYPVFDRWQAHPGRALTISKINAAYRLAEDGFPDDQCDLFDDRIEVDGHLRSVLEARLEGVALADWIIVPGGDTEVDKEAAKLLEAALRQVPNAVETFSHQLTANWYGYAGSEIVWERVGPSVGGVRLAVPTWFHNVPPRRFRFDEHDRPLVITARQMSGEELRPGKWWWSRRPGRVQARSGLMRTLTWWSHIKTMGWRDWAVFANRFGIPFVYGQYDDEEMGVDEDEKAALKQAVQALGTDGWAVFSKMLEIHIVETNKTGGSGELHDRLIAAANAEISKLVEGTTLGVETPSTYGSYAASRETGGRTHGLRVGDGRRAASSFATQLGKMFVTFNSIPAAPPRILFHVIRDDSPRGRGEVFDIARNKLGMRLDEDQVRYDLQLKAVTGAAIEPPAPPPAEGQGDDAQDS